MARPVAQYVTVKTFATRLTWTRGRGAVANAGASWASALGDGALPLLGPTFEASKTVFNLVAADNDFEREFAQFLQDAVDVVSFAKLPRRFGFTIEYTNSATNLRYYESNFVAVDRDGTHYVMETKGQQDIDVAHKDRVATIWCENATLLTDIRWSYVKVPQVEFAKLQPTVLSDAVLVSDLSSTIRPGDAT